MLYLEVFWHLELNLSIIRKSHSDQVHVEFFFPILLNNTLIFIELSPCCYLQSVSYTLRADGGF